MMYGNKPTDGGHFLMTEEEMLQLTAIDPLCSKYIRPFLSAKEYINGLKRYCIWLVNASPQDIRNSPVLSERVELVRKFRKASVAKSTRDYPYHTLFRQVTQPSTDYLVVPRHSSEKRKYIPIGFIPKEIILADSANGIADATLFHFAILTSEMHMTWVRYTCGRIKSDFRYSKDVVYNNFPWPETPTDKHIQTVEEAAQALLDARAQFPESCLADLYDPITMPPLLVKVHQALDKAVDQCYSTQPFISESKRIEYLFGLYEKYTAGMFAEEKPKKVKKLKSDL